MKEEIHHDVTFGGEKDENINDLTFGPINTIKEDEPQIITKSKKR